MLGPNFFRVAEPLLNRPSLTAEEVRSILGTLVRRQSAEGGGIVTTHIPFMRALAQVSIQSDILWPPVLEALKSHGVDLDAHYVDGGGAARVSKTLLHDAVEHGSVALAETLLREGADPFKLRVTFMQNVASEAEGVTSDIALQRFTASPTESGAGPGLTVFDLLDSPRSIAAGKDAMRALLNSWLARKQIEDVLSSSCKVQTP